MAIYGNNIPGRDAIASKINGLQQGRAGLWYPVWRFSAYRRRRTAGRRTPPPPLDPRPPVGALEGWYGPI